VKRIRSEILDSTVQEVFLSKIVLEWLLFEDLTRLDSATSNKTLRICFLENLEAARFDGCKNTFRDQFFMQWISNRKAAMKHIKCFPFYEPNRLNGVQDWCFCSRSFQYVETLELAFCSKMSENGLKLMATQCFNLKELNLLGLTISDEAIQCIVHNCATVVTLVLRYCRVSKAASRIIAQGYPSLKKINLSGVRTYPTSPPEDSSSKFPDFKEIIGGELTDCEALEFSSQCTNLEEIDLSPILVGGYKITDITGIDLSTRCKKLQLLGLGGGITNASLQSISFHLSNLTTLIIRSNESITDEGLELVTKGCKSIVHLYLDGCESLTDTAIFAISKHLPHIKKLELSLENITDESISSISQHCTELTALDLVHCEGLTTFAFDLIAQNMNFLKEFRVLCFGITNNCVQKICKHLHSLEKIFISKADTFDDDEEDLYDSSEILDMCASYDVEWDHGNIK